MTGTGTRIRTGIKAERSLGWRESPGTHQAMVYRDGTEDATRGVKLRGNQQSPGTGSGRRDQVWGPRDEGGGGAKTRNIPQNDILIGEVENGGELGGRRKKRRQESVGAVGADRGYILFVVEKNGSKEEEREEGRARRRGLTKEL